MDIVFDCKTARYNYSLILWKPIPTITYTCFCARRLVSVYTPKGFRVVLFIFNYDYLNSGRGVCWDLILSLSHRGLKIEAMVAAVNLFQ